LHYRQPRGKFGSMSLYMSRLVPEVATAGEYHRQPVAIAGGDYFFVAPRTTRLDDGRNTRGGRPMN
jgi:hypothetical protein